MDLAMAQRLVDRRKAAGLSQEALAAKLNVSRQAVSKWERSESSPDTDNLIALAALYGVSLDELLYGTSPQDPAEEEAPAEPTHTPESPNADDGRDSTTEPTDGTAPRAAKPSVNISWRDGIHVVDPDKGEEVHVGWTGIHVDNDRKDEHVHIGPGGLHVDTAEDDGHSVHTNPDGTVTVDGETYADWKEAHEKLDHHGRHFHTALGRAWNKFPFPAVLLLVYLMLGIALQDFSLGTDIHAWEMGLFLVLLVPVYYSIGDFIDRRRLSHLLSSLYATGVVAWFLYMAFMLDAPSPAWAMLLTIPVMNSLMHWCRKQWKRRSKR